MFAWPPNLSELRVDFKQQRATPCRAEHAWLRADFGSTFAFVVNPVPPAPRALSLVLESAGPLSKNVRSMIFRTHDAARVDWLAGQHIELLVPGATGQLAQKRDYSIATAPHPQRPDRFEIAVTRVDEGPASQVLHALPIGATLAAYGPKGAFRFRPEPRVPVLFVAHGTGLSPLRAMLLEALDDAPPMTLLAGFRTPEDVLWGDQLRALAAEHPTAFTFAPTLSRPPSEWTGLRGRVQAHVAQYVPADRRMQAYLCGLREMTDDVTERLIALGVGEKSIFIEEYD